MNNAATPFVPKSTQYQTQWAVKVFTEWAKHHNSLVSDSEKVPEQFFYCYDCVTSVALLNKWLTRFVLEGTVKEDGSYYTSESVCKLLSGGYTVIWWINSVNLCPIFWPRKTSNSLNWTLPLTIIISLFANLELEVARNKQSTLLQRRKRWCDVAELSFGLWQPEGVVECCFLFEWLQLCSQRLWTIQPEISQLTCVNDPDAFVYTENGSKNRTSRFQSTKQEGH